VRKLAEGVLHLTNDPFEGLEVKDGMIRVFPNEDRVRQGGLLKMSSVPV